ncbi:MAG: hypothetical protein ABIO79_04735 [Ferruginibacter sp.]
MRTRALILLIPFVVFLTETASFTPAMEESCEVVAAEQSSCCMKQEIQEEEACPAKRSGNKEDTGKGCADNSDCTTCPVCYTFIVQSQLEWEPTVFTFKKNYSLLTTGHTSSYTTDVWKPPNGFFYYT